jgi:energy-coupling factor transporter ATP-binding protein EcfA2
MPLLSVEDLRTYFHTRNGVVRAVDGVSFTVDKGETLGIVGESGSGKSVTCYSMMGLIPTPPGRIESGRAMFDGVDLLHCSKGQSRSIRAEPESERRADSPLADRKGRPLELDHPKPLNHAGRWRMPLVAILGWNGSDRRHFPRPHIYNFC